MNNDELYRQAKKVLASNDHGTWTQPAVDVYPNQWMWDSCFIAIGLAHLKPQRAIRELRSLVAGQWQNGMIPHQIFHNDTDYHSGSKLWQSEISSLSPATLSTSGITQPPILAEAVWRIGQQLKAPARRKLFEEFYPKILAYHKWLYTERNPHQEGLIILLHPWETGMDDTPPWMEELRYHQRPWWIGLIDRLGIDHVVDRLRQDIQLTSNNQRISTLDALRLYDVVRRMRRKKYITNQVLRHALFSIEDLFFNCIAIRNNQILEDIAKQLHRQIPIELKIQFSKAPIALEDLWHPESKQYYSRNFVTDEPIASSTVATLMPLYSRAINKKRARQLVELLKNKREFWLQHPIPTVPKSSSSFDEHHYWQGPTWVNVNWLLIDGLRYYGQTDLADQLREKTLDLIRHEGYREYFSPLSGVGEGASNFSWTAALIIDLLAEDAS